MNETENTEESRHPGVGKERLDLKIIEKIICGITGV
jgi:hypothetical protein